MAIDPDAKAFVDAAATQPVRAPGSVPLADFRAALGRLAPLGFDRVELERVWDDMVDATPIRTYRPHGVHGPTPILVWAHGGSWVRGDFDSHDTLLRTLSASAGCIVVAVGYEVSPESRFPRAIDEVYRTTLWVREHAAAIGGDPARILIGGDSSGGNIAAAATLLGRERAEIDYERQVLLMPVLDARFVNTSWTEIGENYMIDRGQLDWSLDQYAPDIDRATPLLSPLLATDHRGLPPALIATCEFDPLRDDGELYADALQRSGVTATLLRFDGLTHHAMLVPKAIPRGGEALQHVADVLRRLLTETAAVSPSTASS
jgi:acetyl esterase/lipase